MDHEHTDEHDGEQTGEATSDLECSARGCREQAIWALLWNNPRIHTHERRKVWLACDDHRTHLERFLGARSFHRATVPVSELPDALAGLTGVVDEP